tara:strand:+ start:1513 stop:2610 length:1098 start_codon:yes stop_codon:yes gene_type:complete
MANNTPSSFKALTTEDAVQTRNLLHEAIPITGSIVSGTYADENIKTYSHGMFESVYDYPYLSSSANHIFDLTCGYSATSGLSGATNSQNSKKINIYNQMSQVLVGFDSSNAIRQFDQDGDLSTGTKDRQSFFINMTRLLSKDEIKKGSFSLQLGVQESYTAPFEKLITITDHSGTSGYKVNSPAGEYGILYATSSAEPALASGVVDSAGRVACGLLYYQAGIAVITSSIFLGTSSLGGLLAVPSLFNPTLNSNVTASLTASTITVNSDKFRHRLYNMSFNNTTELNSSVYFCRAHNTDFNYSANPTYLSASKMVVKNNSQDSPVSFVTTVGLFSPDNELLAVSKLSEPLKKDPTTEFTLRVRLDY